MGGGGSRYRVAPHDDNGHDNWRRPKPQKAIKASAKGGGTPPEAATSWRASKQQAGGQPPAIHRATAAAAAASPVQDVSQFSAKTQALVRGAGSASTSPGPTQKGGPGHSPFPRDAAAGAQLAPMGSPPRRPSKANSTKAGAPDLEEEDEDLEGFSGLADAAAKVWDELMAQRGATKDVKSLFYLSELKDGVERAAKRVEAARQEKSEADERLQERRTAMEDLCARIEAKSSSVDQQAVQWKLKDIAIRRGKGLCDISMIHHEEYPPYFEVRMATDGSIVGTEAKNLLPLSPPQQGVVRAQLRELEDARAAAAAAEEAVEKAQTELKESHQSLTEQVEQKLTETGPPPSRSGVSAGGRPGPGSAPTGMPDIDLVRGWATTTAAEEVRNQERRDMVSEMYPDMRGVREDLRGAASGAAPPAPGAGEQAFSPTFGSPSQSAAGVPAGGGPQVAPAGFPSFDDLLRMDKDASTREKQGAASSGTASYPSAHAGASREAFTRPETTSTRPGDPPESYRSSTGRSSWRGSGQTGGAQDAAGSTPSGGSAPSSGPRVEANGAQAQAARRPTVQGGPSSGEWVQYRTALGQPYYHNERTGETAWSLPVGARMKGDSGADVRQQQASGEPDPFAHLRKKEEEMKQQREQWSSWYSQYYDWYKQQAAGGPNAAPPGAAPHGTKFGAGAAKAAGGGAPPAGAAPGAGGAGGAGAGSGGAQAKMPPRGPAPPKLDAAFEDHATYAIKSSLLKEMEAMVEQGKPLGQRKKALRVLQIRWHPDKNLDRAEVANSVFQFIEETKPWFLHGLEEEEAAK